jgi:outer membrane autotransporter protein
MINGGTVAVMGGPGKYNPLSTATILSAQDGITGRFNSVSSNLAFLTPELSYDTNDVYLSLTRNNVNFGDVATTTNQKNVANAITSLSIGNPLWDGIIGLDAETARAAFDQLSGEVHASAKVTLIEDSRFVRDAALDRLHRGACSTSGGMTSLSFIDPNGGGEGVDCDKDQAVAWTRGFGSWGNINSDGNAARLHHSIGGFLMGVDRQLPDSWRVGILAGYSRSSFDANDRMSSGSSDNYSLGLYGGSRWGNLAFRSGAVYTWHDISTSRGVAFPSFSDNLNGDYHSGTTQLFGELGYGFSAGTVVMEPFAKLTYVNLHTDSFTEKGGAAALTVNSGSTDTTFSTLGVNLSSGIMLGDMKATASGSLGWRHAFGGITPVSTMSLTGSPDFSIAGAPIVRDAALINAGIDLALSPDATVGVSYSGQFGSGITDNSIRGVFKLSF